MKNEPLIIIGAVALVLAVACAIGLNVTHTPVSTVEAVLAAAAPIIGLVLTGRTQVLSQATATNLVKDALEAPPPVSSNAAKEQAASLVKNA